MAGIVNLVLSEWRQRGAILLKAYTIGCLVGSGGLVVWRAFMPALPWVALLLPALLAFLAACLTMKYPQLSFHLAVAVSLPLAVFTIAKLWITGDFLIFDTLQMVLDSFLLCILSTLLTSSKIRGGESIGVSKAIRSGWACIILFTISGIVAFVLYGLPALPKFPEWTLWLLYPVVYTGLSVSAAVLAPGLRWRAGVAICAPLWMANIFDQFYVVIVAQLIAVYAGYATSKNRGN